MPSKLGPHSLRPTPDARAWVEAGCRLVKLVNDFGPASEYLAINPRLIVIGRGYTDQTLLEQYQSGDSPERAAGKFVAAQQARYYSRNPLVKIWEGHNEPSFGSPDDAGATGRMAWYGRFEAERLRLLANLGLRGVVGNFSTGYPEINRNELRMWHAFMPAVEAAKRHGGFLGLHEYAAPWMWWFTGEYQTGNCPGRGRPQFPGGFLGDTGWLTLRYRQVYRYALAPFGLADVPLVITECGNDRAGGGCPGMPAGAWRALTGYWSGWDGSSDPIDYWRVAGQARDAERYYAEQFMWYDRELRKDRYVIGATVFTFGTDNPVWEPFNVAGTRFTPILADYIRGSQAQADDQGNDEFVPPPGPDGTIGRGANRTEPAGDVPPVPPGQPARAGKARGQPREQYARVYLLMPAGQIGPDWVTAAVIATWGSRRLTIGGSADDAGIGNLHSRIVVAVNPETWGHSPPLHAWFAEHYPGVVLTAIHASSPGDLARVLSSVAVPKPSPPPVPSAAPAPPVGQPRTQYGRTYALLSPAMNDPAWVAAIAQAAWTVRRFTIGGSADDAGIGDLGVRRVIALNPDDWGDDLAAWYAAHYPGVEYHGVAVGAPGEVGGAIADLL